jgi:hypothetical protein
MDELKARIGEFFGGDYECDAATKVLQRVTAFTRRDGTEFPGFWSWRGVENNRNPENLSRIAIDQLDRLLADGSLADLIDGPADVTDTPGGNEAPPNSEVPF